MTIRLTLAALAAALVTAALVATTGSAQAPAGTTLHLVSKSDKNVGFFPKARPHQGDHIGFGDKAGAWSARSRCSSRRGR
jgi:hypothetical protein